MKIRPHSVYEFYLFIALALLELLMSFSFLGYFHIAAISITIAYVPILISAICLGYSQDCGNRRTFRHDQRL